MAQIGIESGVNPQQVDEGFGGGSSGIYRLLMAKRSDAFPMQVMDDML